MSTNLLELHGICKSYPGVKALNDISFTVKKGDIHCIIGENGAGKSTLIKILSGAIQKDSGTIIFDGEEVEIHHSGYAKKLGIGTVYQEMSLIPSLNAVDNIFLGEEETNGISLNRASMRQKTIDALKQLSVEIDINIPVSKLSTAQQQMVEVARSIVFKRKLIIMDEPTSSLTQKDVRELFRVIKILKQKQVTIIYISHKLEELGQISDQLTIMRDGCYVDTVRIQETSMQHVISLMVGRDFNINRRPVPRDINKETILEAVNLKDYAGKVKRVSFKLSKGIILGFAGLVGAGRTELMKLIFGADPIAEGQVFLRGIEQKKMTTEKAVDKGIAYLSEDRKNEAIILKMPIRKNISMANLTSVSKGFIINKALEIEKTDEVGKNVHIVTSSYDKLVVYLSGGNQQKVAVAKWLFTNCNIFIFDEPTRGIDVGGRSEIYDLMNRLVDEGKSIILVSSDLIEILSMSNKIIVMHEGKIVGEMPNDESVTQETIMEQMLGGLQNV